ncbi:hypothetical protein L914_10462 [Phytophthora nicotianae]|uniref:RxLR effector protein n=2 Tax=Phytophthora nicotianae TaxID=4792 RepID=V9EYR3_PHYNI|nr:hypothetical protein F443_10874 [Phytophthora nicotianae P1569]ETM44277.1 hypothetical protein L914_10462 [Phytophthora nicotianae]
MRFQCVQVLLLVFVVARIEGLTGADGKVRVKENELRHLKGATGGSGGSTNEERGILSALKPKSMFKKPSNLAVVKKLSGKNLNIGKIQILAGQKLDITKLKTASGKTVDLSKVNLKTTPMKEADISKMKKFAEQDPDLRSVASVVGKNPTQLSAKQVSDVQSFIKKHPEDGLNIAHKMIYGGFGVLFLLLAVGLVTVAVTAIPEAARAATD